MKKIKEIKEVEWTSTIIKDRKRNCNFVSMIFIIQSPSKENSRSHIKEK